LGSQQLSTHIKTLLDDFKIFNDYCPRNLFSGSNFSPEKSLQKNLSIFGLENQSCDRRYYLKSSKNYCPRKLFSGSNFSPEKSSPENIARFLPQKIGPATAGPGVKLPKCLEGPHNTYDRSTNKHSMQHRSISNSRDGHSSTHV